MAMSYYVIAKEFLIHASRDDIPLLSQWIKKSKSEDLDFLVETSGLEPPTPCMSSKYSNQLSYASIYFIIFLPRTDDCSKASANFSIPQMFREVIIPHFKKISIGIRIFSRERTILFPFKEL